MKNNNKTKLKKSLLKIKALIPVSFVFLYFLLLMLVQYIPVLKESFIGYLIFVPMIVIYAIIPLSIFYSIYVIFKMKKLPWEAQAGLIITIATIVFFHFSLFQNIQILYPPPLPTGSNLKAFNENVWIENDQRGIGPTDRQKMLQDVVDKLPGKTKKETISLLGSNFSKYPYDGSTDADLIYYLGSSRMLSPGDEWLLIWFDENGNFEGYYIVSTSA
jgi:hypothetical protein